MKKTPEDISLLTKDLMGRIFSPEPVMIYDTYSRMIYKLSLCKNLDKDILKILSIESGISEDDSFVNPIEVIYSCTHYPLLYPIEYLFKEILFCGKVFIPILELANIVDSTQDWKFDTNYNVCFSNNGKYKFEYSCCSETFLLTSLEGSSTIIGGVDEFPETIYNYQELLDSMNSWKIDYRRLIRNSLALDINNYKI